MSSSCFASMSSATSRRRAWRLGLGLSPSASVPSTRRATLRGGLPILQRERVLFRALAVGGRGSGAIEKVSRKSMVVGIDPKAVVKDPGTGKAYKLGKAAYAHANGIGNQFDGKLPVRPPIRFDGNVQDRNAFGYAVGQILQAHIVKARRKAFKKGIEDAIGGPAGAHTSPSKTINSVLAREWK